MITGNYKIFGFLLSVCMLCHACSKSSSPINNPIDPPLPPANGLTYWVTTGDQLNKLSPSTTPLGFGNLANAYPVISVDSVQQFQKIDGFGYTLTQGSAMLINQLPVAEKNQLLNELFGTGPGSISISFIRIGIGATDLSSSVYTYDDLPVGQTDPTLANFSLDIDRSSVIPVLKSILQINPNIKFLATPWTAPVWMKDNNSSIGGSLNPLYYQVYALYFVKYIQAMQAEGLPVYAITPQNEPLHPGNNPSMFMTANEQAGFIKNNLGPAFSQAGLQTKIIIYDHNCDRPDYPISILNDPAARQYIDGSAFHLYAGDISAIQQVYAAWPSKNVYFTEQYTSSTGNFGSDLRWHLKNVIIGSMRNMSRVALEWNLANDPAMGPHTNGGCTICLGAITVSANTITRNVSYYIIAHASRFVPPGSTRIASDNNGNIHTVAFLRTDGKKVLIVLNDSNRAEDFNIKFNGKFLATNLAGGAVATYVW